MFNPTNAHIDLEALSNNICKIKTKAPKSKILAIIKCNAYGHGAIEVAKRIEQEVDVFGVMFLKEALQLSNANIKKADCDFNRFF